MRSFKLIIIFLIATVSLKAQTQLLDSFALATHPEILEMEEALKNPDAVIKLTLRKKKYKEFPRELYKFKNLQYLDISKNSIQELPDSITQFKNLQYLNVSKNSLKKLPNNFGDLKNLKHVNLNNNDLERLPYTFGNLENLEIADLWYNNLEHFPETMSNLKKLKVMDLRSILIPQTNQDAIQAMLPNTKIYFSPPCKCAW